MIIGILGAALISFITIYANNFVKPATVLQQSATEPTKYILQSVPDPTIIIPSPTPVEKKLKKIAFSSMQITETPKIAIDFPSQLIDLSNWKITLPIGDGKPTEIRQPELANYKIDPWFIINPTENAIRFRAPVTAATTSGSKYPRSELREMTNNGTTNARWDSTNGMHTMFVEQAITAVPQTKKHVVAGQIHDADDDVIVIRLEYPNLYVNVDGQNAFTLDSNYTLGKKFKVKFEASNGQTKIYYNDATEPAFTLDKAYSGAYFKAGAYTQSNCTKENASSCNEQNFGEVAIYNLTVNHN